MDAEEVIVVGSGPAGYAAALYTARAGLRPLVFEGPAWGGMLQDTTWVENYPGFPQGIMGPDLVAAFREQAMGAGARGRPEEITQVGLASDEGELHTVWAGGEELQARAIILAMGASYKRLGVPGEEALMGRGVSTCAVCDGPLHRGKEVVVVGGGDSAVEEALFLAQIASAVTLVHRREGFRAQAALVERLHQAKGVRLLTSHQVSSFEAGASGALELVLVRGPDGQAEEVPAHGAFVAIGHEPRSDLVGDQVACGPGGHIITHDGTTITSRPGAFAAGEVADRRYRQALTAAGSGCAAALDAAAYLRSH
jgi:thioredoxin reductase (NADPH)